MDEALEATGARRRVSVVVSSFLAVPEILAGSDALAVLPTPYANQLARSGRIRTAPLPAALAQPARQMRMTWPAHLDPSRAWQWLRDEIAAAARDRVVAGVDALGPGRPRGARADR